MRVLRVLRVLRVFRHPLFWLTLQAVAVFWAMSVAGEMKPWEVHDTVSYVELAEPVDVSFVLSRGRTYAYPLFMRAVALLGSEWEPLPEAQALFYFGSVLLFWIGLNVYTGSRWLAMAAANPLLYAEVLALNRRIQPDFLAVAATIATFAFVFLLAARPSNRWYWAAVGAGVLITYQLRPSYLFFLLFVPILAIVLRVCRDGSLPRRWIAWTAGLLLVTLLPFLAYCTVRWVAVGHFGLVSYGGFNLLGVAASFLDSKVIKELPKEHRKLARQILQERQNRKFKPYRGKGRVDLWYGQYNVNLWRIAQPIASRMYREKFGIEETPDAAEGGDTEIVYLNDQLSSLSKAIIRARPFVYYKWIFDGFAYALSSLFGHPWIIWSFMLIVISLPILLLAESGAPRAPPPAAPAGAAERAKHPLLGLFVLGTGYFVCHMLLLLLVAFALDRYFWSTIVFIPSLLVAELFEIWRRILAGRAA